MEENQGISVPGEQEGGSLSPELHKQAVVEKARTKGWKPLEEFQGEAADWIDAPEFLGREKLYNTIHDLRRENSKLAKDIGVISKHFANMEESAYQRALNELKDKQAEAVASEDVATVQKTTEEIVKLEKERVSQKVVQQQQAQQQGAAESPELAAWRQQNTWFDGNSEMREDAIAIGIGYAMKNPNKSQNEVLDYVSGKIKQVYPDKFRKPVRKEPVVESGNSSAGEQTPSKKGSKKLQVSDLDEREAATMKTFLKRGVFKDVAAKAKMSEQDYYLNELAKAKGV